MWGKKNFILPESVFVGERGSGGAARERRSHAHARCHWLLNMPTCRRCEGLRVGWARAEKLVCKALARTLSVSQDVLGTKGAFVNSRSHVRRAWKVTINDYLETQTPDIRQLGVVDKFITSTSHPLPLCQGRRDADFKRGKKAECTKADVQFLKEELTCNFLNCHKNFKMQFLEV